MVAALVPVTPQMINMHGRRGEVPVGAIYVGRVMRFLRLAGSKWANPFKIPRDGTRDEVIAKFAPGSCSNRTSLQPCRSWRSKDLACWCAPKRCHAEVLRELANK